MKRIGKKPSRPLDAANKKTTTIPVRAPMMVAFLQPQKEPIVMPMTMPVIAKEVRSRDMYDRHFASSARDGLAFDDSSNT